MMARIHHFNNLPKPSGCGCYREDCFHTFTDNVCIRAPMYMTLKDVWETFVKEMGDTRMALPHFDIKTSVKSYTIILDDSDDPNDYEILSEHTDDGCSLPILNRFV